MWVEATRSMEMWEGNTMTPKRRGLSSKTGVLVMVLGLGMLFGGLLGGCGGGSSVSGSEGTLPAETPSLDKDQPAEFQTASFALG